MNERDFLERLRRGLRRAMAESAPARAAPPHPGAWGPITSGGLAPDERDPSRLAERFAREWESAGGVVLRADRGDALAEACLAALDQSRARSVAVASDPRTAGRRLAATLRGHGIAVFEWEGERPREMLRGPVAEVDAGIVWADLAIADTGTVVLLSSPGQGRSLSLLPPSAIFLVSRVDIVPSRLAALHRVRDLGRAGEFIPAAGGAAAMPSGLTFITGPSRTGDIENDLSVGVHGPGRVFAVLTGEPS